MTKKDLERRNKFLLLQLKIVHKIIDDMITMPNDDMWKAMGEMNYISSPVTIKSCLKYIEEYDEDYNFHDPEMDIKEYE